MAFDPETIRSTRERLLLRLLLRSTDNMNAAMAERVRARGFEGMQASFTGLLANVDTEGTRIGRIADRLHVTRQAASQSVRELERLGYLERIADPADGRAVVVRHTEEGRRMLLSAIAIMLAIEDEYVAVLGRDGLEQLKDLLKKLVEATDSSGLLEQSGAERASR